ncbi:carbohydrate sulfotransferase 11-like [Amphiura filiformis]|uniref:carbohydrate sulfotransferase 11-like n=1 Tax=Amphiura filiformis TaxID=82378 RepID=UPI003B20DFE3
MRTRSFITRPYSLALVILIILAISAYFSSHIFEKRSAIRHITAIYQKQSSATYDTSLFHDKTGYQVDVKTSTRKQFTSERLKVLSETQRQRDQHIKRVCIGELNRRPFTFSAKTLRRDLLLINERLKITFVNDDFKLLVTVVYKTGSQGWKSVFKQLGERGQNVSSQSLARKDGILTLSDVLENSGEEAVAYRLKNYFSVIFVRHPYSRLLSAFRAKLVKLPNDFYVKKARQIIKKIRRVNNLPKDQVPDLRFEEFVQFVANEVSDDEHWCPIYPEVKPCYEYYDFVGHIETLSDDMEYLFHLLGIGDIAEYPGSSQAASSSDTATLKEYFSKISQTTLDKLNSKYKNDFKVFGYRLPINNSDFN